MSRRMRRGNAGQGGAAAPQAGILKNLIGSICEIQKISTASHARVQAIFAEVETSDEYLKDVVYDAITEFRLDPNLKRTIIKISPNKVKTERILEHVLPEYTEGTLYRIVIVSGSHELFYPISMTKLLQDQAVFLPQGSAFKISPSHGNFLYNDEEFYDKTRYEGRGFKRPEGRHIIVIDFTTEDQELIQKQVGSEIDTISRRMSNGMGSQMAFIKETMAGLFGKGSA
jgi:hypothetical protein